MKRTTLGLLLGLTSLTVVACANQAAMVRPKEGTAGDATGEKTCDAKRVGGDSEPFAVDWSDANRASLESAMQRGVAVVKYSCEGIEVLKGCSVAGDYAYRGISKKTKVVQMKDMSAVAANLGPTTLPVAVQAEMKQGKGLDLAYVMVGSEATTVQTVSRDMLKGRCDGATHFVYEANLGAFALDTNVSGEAKAAAQVFGQGGLKAEGASAKSTRTTDGDVQACDKATDEGKAKTEGCKAVVRVSLFAIAESATKGSAEAALVAPDARSCPAGFSYVDGACEKQAAKAALCAADDVAGCKTQCQAGSVESCGRFGAALVKRSYTPGFTVKSDQRENAIAVLKGFDAPLRAACDKGEGAACWAAAMNVMASRPTDADFLPEGRDVPELVPLMVKGCKAGDTVSCYYTLMTYGDGLLKGEKVNPVPADPAKMIDLVGLGCDRGNPMACFMLSSQIFNVRKSTSSAEERAKLVLKYARRACTGGVKEGCAIAGAVQQPATECSATLKAIEPGLKKGNEIFRSFVSLDEECPSMAPVTNPEGAKEMFELGCKRGEPVSCSKK
jgi:hypothetical protein